MRRCPHLLRMPAGYLLPLRPGMGHITICRRISPDVLSFHARIGDIAAWPDRYRP